MPRPAWAARRCGLAVRARDRHLAHLVGRSCWPHGPGQLAAAARAARASASRWPSALGDWRPPSASLVRTGDQRSVAGVARAASAAWRRRLGVEAAALVLPSASRWRRGRLQPLGLRVRSASRAVRAPPCATTSPGRAPSSYVGNVRRHGRVTAERRCWSGAQSSWSCPGRHVRTRGRRRRTGPAAARWPALVVPARAPAR